MYAATARSILSFQMLRMRRRASRSPRIAADLFAAGVDVMTSGNHIFDKKEAITYIEASRASFVRRTTRPECRDGRWAGVVKAFSSRHQCSGPRLHPSDDPFRIIDEQLAALDRQIKVILVDIHGEATSEKVAMGRYLDGRVSAVVGTHTTSRPPTRRFCPAAPLPY
jgi:calcineurin-like phosphoesterase